MGECRIIRGDSSAGHRGKQGLDHSAGISAERCGSRALCRHLLVLPPVPRPGPASTRTTSPPSSCWGIELVRYGPHLEQVDTVQAEDLVHIPAGVLHQPFDPTDRPAGTGAGRPDRPRRAGERVLL